MTSPKGIHWVAPVTTICTLLTGCLLALGHHLFYASLAGKAAPTSAYKFAGAAVSKQQFNTAVGTAFAFLVKAALALAVSVAYVQVFWHAAQTSRKGIRLSVLDTTSSILTNLTGIVKLHVWAKHPLLLLLAIVVWTIPIASIVTPATISIHGALLQPPPSAMTKVPQFDFTSYDFAAPLTYPNNYIQPTTDIQDGNGTYVASPLEFSTYCYRGPAQLVDRVAAAVGAQGQILPITPPSQNASWTLDFWGPSLQCSSVEGQDRQDIWDNVANSSSCASSWGYLAWAPTASSVLPFINGTLQSDSLASGVPTMIYVAVLPEMVNPNNELNVGSHTLSAACQAALDLGRSWPPLFNSSTLLRCMFLNTSYHAGFDYVNGEQNISVTKTAYDDSGAFVALDCVRGPASDEYSGDLNNKSCSTLNVVGEACIFEPNLLRTLAYQGIADAFGQLFQGTVGLSEGPGFPYLTYNSSIVRTVLLDTDELSFVQAWSSWTDLANASTQYSGTNYTGLSNNVRAKSRGSLSKTLEDMFQNMTISLLSEASLQPNYTSLYAPFPKRNVTFSTYQNVYSYARNTLWIAYGLAIAFASLAVAIGLGAMVLNGASYDTNFSTILRVSKATEMSEEMEGTDGDGCQPLPKRLAKARVLIDKGGERNSGKTSLSSGVTFSNELQSDATAESNLLPAGGGRAL